MSFHKVDKLVVQCLRDSDLLRDNWHRNENAYRFCNFIAMHLVNTFYRHIILSDNCRLGQKVHSSYNTNSYKVTEAQ